MCLQSIQNLWYRNPKVAHSFKNNTSKCLSKEELKFLKLSGCRNVGNRIYNILCFSIPTLDSSRRFLSIFWYSFPDLGRMVETPWWPKLKP